MDTFDRVWLTYRVNDKYVLMDFHLGSSGVKDNCWFCVSDDEVEKALKVYASPICDGYRRIEIGGDVTLVYSVSDMTCSRHSVGEMEVKYHRVSIPLVVWNILLRYCKVARRVYEQRAAEGILRGGYIERDVVLELSKERIARWLKRYGLGKGKVRAQASDEVLEMLEESARQPDERLRRDFIECRERVEQIARNTTWRWDQEASVRWWKDFVPGSFCWATYTPEGKCTLNGGLILHHDSDGTPREYGLHT